MLQHSRRGIVFILLFMIMLWTMLSCSDDDNMVYITIKSAYSIDFSDNAHIRITLWGYDRYIADASATALYEYYSQINKLPFNHRFVYIDSWTEKIEYQSGEDKFGFYLTFEIDDGDDRFCIDRLNTDDDLVNFSKYDPHSLSGTYYILKCTR